MATQRSSFAEDIAVLFELYEAGRCLVGKSFLGDGFEEEIAILV